MVKTITLYYIVSHSPRFKPWAMKNINYLVVLKFKLTPSKPTPTQATAQPETDGCPDKGQVRSTGAKRTQKGEEMLP